MSGKPMEVRVNAADYSYFFKEKKNRIASLFFQQYFDTIFSIKNSTEIQMDAHQSYFVLKKGAY